MITGIIYLGAAPNCIDKIKTQFYRRRFNCVLTLI